jgi:transglutaminase-like putative cysteine protease
VRFGLVHRVMTDLLAALGVLAVVSTAQMTTEANVVLILGLVLALAVPEAWQSKSLLRHVATVGPVALFIVEGVRLAIGKSALDVAVEFAATLQIIRIATRRGAAHDQQIIVLALLHFVAGTVLGGGFAYGLCFLGFVVVAPGALVLSHLRREVEGNYRQGARDRTGLPVDVPRILRSRRVVGRQFLTATCFLSIPIFLFTAALFVLFPRVGLSLLLLSHGRSGRMVGFSDRVDLGQVGMLRSDPAIALRFTPDDLPDPPPAKLTLRLRGTAFDAYDGRAWKRTLVDHQPAYRGSDLYPIFRYPDVVRDHRIAFDLEPIDPPVIFLPPRTVGLRVRAQGQALMGEPLGIYHGPEGEIRYGGSDIRGLHYEAFVAGDTEGLAESLPPSERPRYLLLGPDLPSRVGDLARKWTDGLPTVFQKAKAIEDHLRKDYRYDTNSPSGAAKQPLDDFLFVSHRGHCEFFSTAMAIMLRDVGVPSRNVTGFVGGTYNRFGKYYAVREGDAHSWVEAYIDDVGRPTWMTFDPTPSAGAQPLEDTTGPWVYLRDLVEALSQRWNRYVVGYDLRTQVHLFEDISRRYERLRSRTGVNHGPLDKLTRAPAVAGSLLGLSVLAYLAWKRRRSAGSTETRRTGEPPDRNLETATMLYRALEGALALNGITRPVSLPPLRHAEDLRARRHPLAEEVVALTLVYLEARFGGNRLDDDSRRAFERRVRAIRAWRRNNDTTLESPTPS